MSRSEVILLIRHLLKRMENEEFTFQESFGHTDVPKAGGYLEIKPTKIDTFTLKFTGPKQPTVLPPVLIVWRDGWYEKRHYTSVRGIRRHNERPVYMYCPIKLSTIHPENHRAKMRETFINLGIEFIPEGK